MACTEWNCNNPLKLKSKQEIRQIYQQSRGKYECDICRQEKSRCPSCHCNNAVRHTSNDNVDICPDCYENEILKENHKSQTAFDGTNAATNFTRQMIITQNMNVNHNTISPIEQASQNTNSNYHNVSPLQSQQQQISDNPFAQLLSQLHQMHQQQGSAVNVVQLLQNAVFKQLKFS